MYTGALENYPRLIERMQQIRPLLGNAAEVLDRVRDPWQVAAAFGRRDLPCPALAADPAEVPPDGTWLRKSRRSAGGMQVSLWLGGNSTAAETASQPRSAFYFQQRIEGVSCSAVYLAAGGQVRLVGVTEQLLAGQRDETVVSATRLAGSGRFQYAGSIGPLPINNTLQRRFLDIGQVLADEFHLQGLFGADCVLAQEIPWPVEVNPRYTASVEILERAAGLPYVGWHVAACRDGHLPPVVPSTPVQLWGKAILYARRELVVQRCLTDHAASLGGWPLLGDVPAVGSRIAAGQPILTVFARGPNRDQVGDRLRSQIDQTEAVVYSGAGSIAVY